MELFPHQERILGTLSEHDSFALFLGAQRVDRDDEREYEMPSEIKVEDIPQELLDFFSRMSDENISDDELFKSEVKVKLMEDCTVTYGWGGCHQGTV